MGNNLELQANRLMRQNIMQLKENFVKKLISILILALFSASCAHYYHGGSCPYEAKAESAETKCSGSKCADRSGKTECSGGCQLEKK